MIYHEGDQPRAGLVMRGLFRVYMTSPEGRQVTVRYARRGDVLGTAVLLGGPVATAVQALTNASVLAFNLQTLEALARGDPQIAWALAEEVTRRLYDTLAELAGNTFGTVRQRVARHLLDLAAQGSAQHGLVANVSQQDLADAVGSVREVVARALRDLRADGLIETRAGSIIVRDPVRLHGETWRGSWS
jgi:CRP/FNR family transcriptional regulator